MDDAIRSFGCSRCLSRVGSLLAATQADLAAKGWCQRETAQPQRTLTAAEAWTRWLDCCVAISMPHRTRSKVGDSGPER